MNEQTINKTKEVLRNHIKGIVYGQALGDAVGLQMEFKSKLKIGENISEKIIYPYKEPIRDFPLCDYTDDTDQMILLLDMIIESDHNFYEGTLEERDINNFADKLLRWKLEGFPELGDTRGNGLGGATNLVLNHKEFLKSPIDASREVWNGSGKKIAANGAIMRTSILSILNIYKFLREPLTIHQDFYRSIRSICLTTHYDARCIISCWMLCYLIQRVLLFSINRDSKSIINTKIKAYKTFTYLLKMIPLSHYPSSEKIKELRHQPVPDFYAEEEFFNEKGIYLPENELLRYCKTGLTNLNLDESSKRGYTYKCLGCAFWVMDIISTHEKVKLRNNEITKTKDKNEETKNKKEN